MDNINSIILDQKYISLLSGRLEQFKNKGRGIYICRCPICKDSKVDKKKRRFYFFNKGGRYNVYCHNCDYSHKFFTLLKQLDSKLYEDYTMELFKETGGYKIQAIEEPEDVIQKYEVNLKSLKKISSLPATHPAKRYVDSRKIPPNTHFKLFFTEHFGKWINSIIPKDEDGNEKIAIKTKFDPRIVLFITDRSGNIVGCQGRSINPKSTLRYITIKFDESFPKIFGLQDFNPNKQGFIFEGPIDSLFIPNSLAMTGSDVSLSDLLQYTNGNLKRLTFIFDNEPRNREINNKIQKAINAGCQVCIWPPSMLKYNKGDKASKDVNDFILNGLTAAHIQNIIETNTFAGLDAQLRFDIWRKT